MLLRRLFVLQKFLLCPCWLLRAGAGKFCVQDSQARQLFEEIGRPAGRRGLGGLVLALG